MKTNYYIFGSKNSQDYDISVKIDNIPDITESHSIVKQYEDELSHVLTDKPLNVNLVVITNGVVTDCFKGTSDELNNSIYYTYDLHKENIEPCPIQHVLERDIPLKMVRISRFLITFFSRTHLRSSIKNALRSKKLSDRIEVLGYIDYTVMKEFPHKKEKIEDIYKVIAFQFGQIFSLIDGHEPDSYTKYGIQKNYPDLSIFLQRDFITDDDLGILNEYLDRFIQISKKMISELGDVIE